MRNYLTLMMIAVTMWAVANAAFVVGWEVTDNRQHLSDSWSAIAFAVVLKVWAIETCWVGAMILLWAIYPKDKPQSPSGLWH